MLIRGNTRQQAEIIMYLREFTFPWDGRVPRPSNEQMRKRMQELKSSGTTEACEDAETGSEQNSTVQHIHEENYQDHLEANAKSCSSETSSLYNSDAEVGGNKICSHNQ